MKKYLLQETGNFYKANLHCHSTLSDGKHTPEELKAVYRNLGYSIIAYTDHDILIPHDDLNDEKFLALNGFEVEINPSVPIARCDRKSCHICFIALDPDNITQPCWSPRYLFANAVNYAHLVKYDKNEPEYIRQYDGEAISQMMREGRNKGFFVTYNHPTWSLEAYPQYMSYNNMNAFEMFNGGCNAAGWDDYNPRVYDDMLMGGKKLYCIVADDNHNHGDAATRFYDSGWAWTMIKADSLDYRKITEALVDGQFYASEGPEIHELWFEDGKIHVRCSEADKINCNYGARHAEVKYSENGVPITEAVFGMNPDWKYCRITVTDKQGKHACTNAYFAEDLFEE